VQRHYPPESDRQMRELIGNILAALKEKMKPTAGWIRRRGSALSKACYLTSTVT
jgi:hypothetical protein